MNKCRMFSAARTPDARAACVAADPPLFGLAPGPDVMPGVRQGAVVVLLFFSAPPGGRTAAAERDGADGFVRGLSTGGGDC